MSYGKCGHCKNWLRGTIMKFADDATQWDGTPHPYRGQTKIRRPRWHCHKNDQDVGECLLTILPPNGSAPLIVATCDTEGIYGELVTDASFGCVAFSMADADWDHYEHRRYPDTEKK